MSSPVWACALSGSFAGKRHVFNWHITVTYDPNDRQEREDTWGEIEAARSLMSGPWILCGDFNTTRHPLEKKNCIAEELIKPWLTFQILMKIWN